MKIQRQTVDDQPLCHLILQAPVNVIRVRGWMKYQHDGPGQRHPDEEGEQTSVELWNSIIAPKAFVGFSTVHTRALSVRRFSDWLEPHQ